MKYRLLGVNEIIQENDEFLDDDCINWHPAKKSIVVRALLEKPYNPLFLVPLRRPIEAPAEESLSPPPATAQSEVNNLKVT